MKSKKKSKMLFKRKVKQKNLKKLQKNMKIKKIILKKKSN